MFGVSHLYPKVFEKTPKTIMVAFTWLKRQKNCNIVKYYNLKELFILML